MDTEDKLIFGCCKINLDDLGRARITKLIHAPLDWGVIREKSQRHKVSPFLYYNLSAMTQENSVPQEIMKSLKESYMGGLYKNTVMEKAAIPFFKAASAHNLGFIIIKGFALTHLLYRDAGLRPMCDIDILIKENERNKLAQILEKEGYEGDFSGLKGQNRFIDQLIFAKDTVLGRFMLDVHWTFFSSRPYKINLPSAWERLQLINIDGQRAPCLSLEDTLLVLVLHARRHTRNLGLNQIVDIAELIKQHALELDWEYINKESGRNHFLMPLYFCLYLAQELLEAKIPETFMKRLQPNIVKRWLIMRLINKANFLKRTVGEGRLIRFLLFDRLVDFLVYLWRVVFLEKFIYHNCQNERIKTVIP